MNEVSYVRSEIEQLEREIISLGPVATVAPTAGLADMDVALVHLRSVRVGLQTLQHALDTLKPGRLKLDEISRQIEVTVDGFATVIVYLQESIDKISPHDQLASGDEDDYLRKFKSAVQSSPAAYIDRQDE